MDKFWEFSEWKPTDALMNIDSHYKPAQSYVEEHRTSLIEAATDVKELPYWQKVWLDRAAQLLHLGFPDLAIADAYKGMLLCKAGLDYDHTIGEHVRLVVGLNLSAVSGYEVHIPQTRLKREVKQRLTLDLCKAYQIQIQALKRLDATPDVISICLEATKAFPDRKTFSSELREAKSYFQQKIVLLESQGLEFDDFKRRLIFGGWNPHLYPWMPTQYRVRNEAIVKAANSNLKKISNGIEIRLSQLGTEDCYGAFATRKIHAGETISGDKFLFAVSPEQGATQCYNCFTSIASIYTVFQFACCPSIGYCSSDCQDDAKRHYHAAICGRDFSSILNRSQQLYGGNAEGSQYGRRGTTELGQITGWPDKPSIGYPMTGRPLPDQTPCVMIRILSMCVHTGGHPLDHPLVSQLVQGPPVVVERFSMNGMVIAPIKALQVLGIDIFANDQYDTWVLRTIWMRIANNVMGSETQGFPSWLLGQFCWFNHSCDPNTGPGTRNTSSIVENQIALRDIERGEEICIKYINISANRATRARMLMAWFGGNCKCARCGRESLVHRQ